MSDSAELSSSEPTINSVQSHIVGIGASAGGLEALSAFVGNVPEGLGCVYIIAQHMSPNHRSMMVDILSRESVLPVQTVIDGGLPEPENIYVVPPGFNLSIREGVFRLQPPLPEVSPKPSINLLFQSMAEYYDERAVGIILSGTGSDGTSGLRAIKAAGGITFAQLPESAKYDGMPRSAIESGVVDRIMMPDQMGRDLERLIKFPSVDLPHDDTDEQTSELTRLFDEVRQKTKIDFSSYKLSTVLRRLQRRFLATETESLSAYLGYIEQHPNELDSLAKETLISVTEFFRDKESQKALERHVKELIARRKANEEIRVWVVGCATGEEAYSLAILFNEHIRSQNSKVKLQVFATDIDNEALSFARRGFFNSATMAEVPQEYLNRYFRPSGNGFEPIKELRDCIVFARQDIVSDPPFLKVDLISCRNVLIYFNADLQSKVLSTLHYALKSDGLLFLGKSESVNQKETLFSVLDRRARIFQSRGGGSALDLKMSRRGRLPLTLPPKKQDQTHERQFFEAVRKFYAPYAMLIDSAFNIIYLHGSINKFIDFPSGRPDMNLAQIIVPEFRNELLTTLHRARRHQKTVYSRKRRIASLDFQTWRLAMHPLEDYRENEIYLVAFEETGKSEGNKSDSVNLLASANEAGDDDELQTVREHLQTLLEEMASSNEEMQALNEEVQASNEELQATNEELEAANEELQATNEELISVNEESLIKSAELAALNSEFESLYNTMDFPILVFDCHLILKRSNLSAMRQLDISMSGNNRHVSRIDFPPHLIDIEKRLLNVIDKQRKENYTTYLNDRSYQVYITPTQNNTGVTQSIVLFIIDNTELVAANRLIKETQDKLLSIMNHSPYLVSLKDTAGRYEFVNYRFCELFGVSGESILGKTDRQLFSQEIADPLRRRDLEAMENQALVQAKQEFKIGARSVFLESTHFSIFDQNGVARSICMQAIDVTQKQQAEEQLRLAVKVFDRAGEAIMITDASGHIIKVNDAFTTITGYQAGDVIGRNPSILQSGLHDDVFYEAMWNSIRENGGWQGEINNRRADGTIYPEWLTISAVHDVSGALVNYVGIFSDVSAMKASQNRIEHLATHDELTGLPNRTLLMDRLKHNLFQAKRKKESLAVLFIDLDNFKNINDALGHEAGDILLKQATDRLLSCMRDADTLARLGGDEFVAVLYNIDGADINRIAIRIVDSLSASFRIYDRDCFVSCSMGISIYPQDGEDSTTLLKNADTAMYRAKDQGRNQFQYFADEMKLKALQRLTIETGLRLAMEHQRLFLHYQPKIDLSSGLIIGAEALLRWHDPNLGNISPAQFIPVAESCGLINKLGEQVMTMVAADIHFWKQKGVEVPPIAINLSVHQLRDKRFGDMLLSHLSEFDIPAQAITLEITESMLMERMEETERLLADLSAQGFKISIDDFGTGYSSLFYLKKLPIDELKVDRSFVDGIDEQSEDRSITDAIINMAHALHLKVVAEGVETEAQLRVLCSLDCDVVQGYYYYRPLSANQFYAVLAQ
ncbi:MAG: hypothetical protein Kow0065_04140 [Methylomicrobium sp.]